MSREKRQVNVGDGIKCVASNPYGFAIGKVYTIFDAGVDSYSNSEMCIKSENGKQYFVYAVNAYFKSIKSGVYL